jgi:hypothetical protein
MIPFRGFDYAELTIEATYFRETNAMKNSEAVEEASVALSNRPRPLYFVNIIGYHPTLCAVETRPHIYQMMAVITDNDWQFRVIFPNRQGDGNQHQRTFRLNGAVSITCYFPLV